MRCDLRLWLLERDLTHSELRCELKNWLHQNLALDVKGRIAAWHNAQSCLYADERPVDKRFVYQDDLSLLEDDALAVLHTLGRRSQRAVYHVIVLGHSPAEAAPWMHTKPDSIRRMIGRVLARLEERMRITEP